MKRRDDIDGLRAIAVLAVVLDHAGLGALPGGFVGVDIFFVISGFLISRIITDGVANGSFTLAHFWERRARRILPALIVVVAVSLIAGHLLLLPDDYENLAQSAFATMLFANNVLLTLTSGYWDLAATFKPLLHTWSLGVEEQFYIAYPLAVLLVLRHRPSWFGPALMTGFIVSLGMSVALSPGQPDASFYLIHTRAWELLLGALAAHVAARVEVSPPVARILSLIGLATIGAAIGVIGDGVAYPGWRALAPCLGTALILLYAPAGGFAPRLLSWPPLVWIGLASYSIYLWHQPLFAFARALSATPPGPGLMATLTLATLVIGFASTHWIERPFRDARRVKLRAFLVVIATTTTLIVTTALAIYLAAGLPQRMPGMGLERGDYAAYNQAVHRFHKDAFSDTIRPKLLVIGSSTARDLINAMVESGRFRDYEIVYRPDISFCALDHSGQVARKLVETADALVFVASFSPHAGCRTSAAQRAAGLAGKAWLYVGPKHFGYNLNHLKQVPPADRPTARATLLPETVQANRDYARLVSPDRYVDILAIMDWRYGGMPVFDAQGRILSVDRIHLTRAGAAFFGATIFDDPAWRPIFAFQTPSR